LPTPDPNAAADELERAVTKLGFKGAMIMGLTHGRFMDDKQFRPIFERAVALDVPLYIHPTLTHTFRLIVSGLFDAYPTLKIIVGHLGETAPFLLWRTNALLNERMPMPRAFADYYREHFWLTTSGAFSDSALTCSIAEMGVERIMFSVDWPFMHNLAGRKWLDAAPVSDHDRALIFGANARKLLKL
jgi:predicted TIM-barrel fold metal-dependent hydrolase